METFHGFPFTKFIFIVVCGNSQNQGSVSQVFYLPACVSHFPEEFSDDPRMCYLTVALEVMIPEQKPACLPHGFNGCGEEEQVITGKPYTEHRRADTKPEEKSRTHIKVEDIPVSKSSLKGCRLEVILLLRDYFSFAGIYATIFPLENLLFSSFKELR